MSKVTMERGSFARRGARLRALAVVGSIALGACLPCTAAAKAPAPAPAWTITSVSEPTNFAPGNHSGQDHYAVTAINMGGAATNGSQITVTDTLPARLTLNRSGAMWHDDAGNSGTCSSGHTITCIDKGTLMPGQSIYVTVPVDAPRDAHSTVTNAVAVSGGGAQSASASEPTTISSSPPSFAVQEFDGSVWNSDGSTDTQAGSHPFEATTRFALSTALNSQGQAIAAASAKDLIVALPPGLVGAETATPHCTQAQLEGTPTQCPIDSQVGVVTIYQPQTPYHEPVYNMVPPRGTPAEFGFRVLDVSVFIHISVRTGKDYGLTATVPNVPQALPLIGSSLTFWGVPGSPLHNSQRCSDFGLVFSGSCSKPHPFHGQLKPFLTLPTACLGPQTTRIKADSWQHPGVFSKSSFVSHDNHGHPIGASGCNRLQFKPSLSIRPDTTVADSPSGLRANLAVPYNASPTGLAEAELKVAKVVLPQGVSLNPATANGLKACTPAQIGIHNAKKPHCPNASKVGTDQVTTPLLPKPLKGGIYVAQQGHNPFRSLLAIYVVAGGDGVLVKLAGHVVANRATGQLTTTFPNNPQQPFTDFSLQFFGGALGTLATPTRCGSYTTSSSLEPWSGTAAAKPSSTFAINSGCVSGFKPTFIAGSDNAHAGAFAPFVVSFSRSDTDQYFSGLSLTLPEGVLAKLAGVKWCSNAELARAAASSGKHEQAHPSCPPGSQVGTVETGAGAGPLPYFLPGKVYLTGPYKGAPYGLAVVVPAVAGPYDLGTVVVRQRLEVDPYTTQVTAISDPLPQILKGIPLRVRRVDVYLNRRQFTLNPTSCGATSVTGILTSAEGTAASVQSRFKVGGCSRLKFSPKLKISLTGKGRTRSGDHPTLTSVLTQTPHQSNLRLARVKLPLALALDPNNSSHVCPYKVAKRVGTGRVGCPKSTIIGYASASTPLLSKPVAGHVYLVEGLRFIHGQPVHTLPTLLVALRGQVALDLTAKTSVSHSEALVTTFPAIPDAPVSKFVLRINGGPKGILVITGSRIDICKRALAADATLGAQNGKRERHAITMSTPCGARRS